MCWVVGWESQLGTVAVILHSNRHVEYLRTEHTADLLFDGSVWGDIPEAFYPGILYI